jgi:hypothetical protein
MTIKVLLILFVILFFSVSLCASAVISSFTIKVNEGQFYPTLPFDGQFLSVKELSLEQIYPCSSWLLEGTGRIKRIVETIDTYDIDLKEYR